MLLAIQNIHRQSLLSNLDELSASIKRSPELTEYDANILKIMQGKHECISYKYLGHCLSKEAIYLIICPIYENVLSTFTVALYKTGVFVLITTL